jgi:hypothetical protein
VRTQGGRALWLHPGINASVHATETQLQAERKSQRNRAPSCRSRSETARLRCGREGSVRSNSRAQCCSPRDRKRRRTRRGAKAGHAGSPGAGSASRQFRACAAKPAGAGLLLTDAGSTRRVHRSSASRAGRPRREPGGLTQIQQSDPAGLASPSGRPRPPVRSHPRPPAIQPKAHERAPPTCRIAQSASSTPKTIHRAAPKPAKMQGLCEADGGTRTPGPFITSEVLYQLSYVGVAGVSRIFRVPGPISCRMGLQNPGRSLLHESVAEARGTRWPRQYSPLAPASTQAARSLTNASVHR